ncbi:MAG TPA: hypothetical protein VHU13_09950 [Solirubrobacteraceae bacterium]|jgi:hypothetical protein|nr:hypothetical protein [Solirubrobacteraceae bacterium]
MYHLELRQFPHNFCRFNLSKADLLSTVLDAWSRRLPLELGERRWDPDQASLTILEGPQLAAHELSMGRGWRNAQRQGRDVTATLLAGARANAIEVAAEQGLPAAASTGARGGTGASGTPEDPAVRSLAVELLALLGDEPEPLLRAWQLALQRHPDRSPSQCLELAEDFVRR